VKTVLLRASAVLLGAAALAPRAHAGRLAGELSPYLLERDGDAVAWWPWSGAALGEARHAKRPVFLLVGRAGGDACPASERALVAVPDVVGALAKRYVSVAVDADERPDVAALYATAPVALGQEPEADDAALWAVLTPDGWPYAAGRVHDDGVWRAAFAARLERLADDPKERAGEVSARAGAALAALRAAQSSEPPLRPLAADTIRHALDGLRDAFDPATGRFGRALHGPLRLLLAESARGDEPARRLLARALDALAREDSPACGLTLTETALRLRAFARAYALGGEARYRAAAERLAGALLALREPAGALRAAPGDARVFAAPNGWAIGALAVSGAALGRPGDLAAARAAATATLAALGPAASMRRVARGGDARGSAWLEDYAALAEGLLDLDDASRDARARGEAAALVAAALGRFADPRGGFFDSDAAHEPLPARLRDGYDGDGLSANGVMASVLARLSAATGEAQHQALARGTVAAFLGDVQRAPRGLESLAAAAGDLLGRAAATPAPAAPEALPARATAGPVDVALSLVPGRARPGAALEARLALTIAPGFTVNAHRPGSRDLSGLSVALLTRELAAGAASYPVPADVRRRFAAQPVAAYVGTAQVVVPLRVPAGAAPGSTRVRVRVAFQACDARACRAPDSVVIEAPLEVAAR
jgi:uncharacterized protein YyaL (SSP411 family)